MSVIDEWKGSLPVLLPIIGEFSGSICSIKNYSRGRYWNEEKGDWTEIIWSEIVFNRLQITFRGNKFSREIRVIHYGRKLYRDMRQEYYEPCVDMWPDFCLRLRDWKVQLEMESIVQEKSRLLLERLEKPTRSNNYLTKEQKLVHHKIGISKTCDFEVYALREALKKIVNRYQKDIHNYKLSRD